MNILCPFRTKREKNTEKLSTCIKKGKLMRTQAKPSLYFNIVGGSVLCGFGKIVSGIKEQR